MKQICLAAALLSTFTSPVAAEDFGLTVQKMLSERSMPLFGIAVPLAETATPSVEEGYRLPAHTAADSIALAEGLTAEFVTRDAADHLDMMAFYPAAAPTHIIGCIESDLEEIADGKLNPGVQRISLADGKVETIIRGTNSCDGIRTTPWGTILFTEEDDKGGAYEILNPLTTTGVVLTDRANGVTSDPEHVARRMALPTMSWEGIAILPGGVVYAGDELRPGTDVPRSNGGSIFKFIPTTPATPGDITSLDASPFAAGKTYAMQVQCRGDEIQYGQGCETGKATWIEVDPTQARSYAEAKGATGYYRPEDLHLDSAYTGAGARFCHTNTGNEGAQNYAEVNCVTDATPLDIPVADAEGKLALNTVVTRFLEGDSDANSFDNLDFQPGTGNLYVVEDHPNGDIWACLPDGADRDLKTDGCIKMLSVNDTSAEPTGFIFASDGLTAYVSFQHSDDTGMAKVDDYGTDDLIKITGFAPVAQ